MSYRSPDKLEVIELAKSFNWLVNDEQAELLTNYIAPFADGYDWLDSVCADSHTDDFTGRTFEAPAENPHNAWYVRTNIPAASSGPLAGKTIAVKDNIFVAGVPLSNGAGFLKDFIADFDAVTVRRVLDAGGNIVGKSNCEYFCLSGGSATCDHGPVDNPRKAGYSTAGSSSGSAALVAGGYVDLALGTDQGGSVRSPASWTGICGMKATRGTVPYNGGTVIESTIDYIGPMSQRVEDNALLLDVIADPRPGSFQDLLGKPLNGLRVGVLSEGFAHPLSANHVDECVRKAAEKFASLGATVTSVSVPMHLNGLSIWGAVVSDGFWQSLRLRGLGYNYEGNYSQAWFHAMEDWQQHLATMPINAQVLILLGKHLEQYEGRYYAAAKNFVEKLKSAYDAVLQEVDVLLLPTTVQQAGPNPAADDITGIFAHAFNNTINTAQFNASGHPALSIPCAVRNDLPVGLMLVGRYMEEALLYQFAYAFEQAVDWQRV